MAPAKWETLAAEAQTEAKGFGPEAQPPKGKPRFATPQEATAWGTLATDPWALLNAKPEAILAAVQATGHGYPPGEVEDLLAQLESLSRYFQRLANGEKSARLGVLAMASIRMEEILLRLAAPGAPGRPVPPNPKPC